MYDSLIACPCKIFTFHDSISQSQTEITQTKTYQSSASPCHFNTITCRVFEMKRKVELGQNQTNKTPGLFTFSVLKIMHFCFLHGTSTCTRTDFYFCNVSYMFYL